MSRRKKLAVNTVSDSSDEDKAPLGIFAHKVHRFKKKGGPSAQDSGSDLASDDSDDDLSDAPSTRKRGRPGKKGAPLAVQNKRNDPLLLDGEDEGGEILHIPQPSLKPQVPKQQAKATGKASDPSSFRTLKVLDDEAYMSKLPQAPVEEKDEALERLREEQQHMRQSRMALQQANVMPVNLDPAELANATAVPGMQEREKVVLVIQKDQNPEGTILKYRIYTTDPIRIRLLGTYADSIRANLRDMVFFFGDKEVTTHDTAKTLGISESGMIVWRSKTEMAEAAAKAAAASKGGKTIMLKMRFDQKSEVTIKVGENDTFEKIQQELAKAIEAEPSDLRLMLDGDVLDPKSTPKNEDLEDDNIIEVATN